MLVQPIKPRFRFARAIIVLLVCVALGAILGAVRVASLLPRGDVSTQGASTGNADAGGVIFAGAVLLGGIVGGCAGAAAGVILGFLWGRSRGELSSEAKR
jgi:amino acid transporter